MKLTLTPTENIGAVVAGGAECPCRLWTGHDEHGVPVVAYITRVAIREDQPAEVHERFGRELKSCEKTKPDTAIPLRLIL